MSLQGVKVDEILLIFASWYGGRKKEKLAHNFQFSCSACFALILESMHWIIKIFVSSQQNLGYIKRCKIFFCQTPVLGQGFSPRLILGVDYTIAW